MSRQPERTLSLDTLCDFIGGSSLVEIADRYRLSPEAAEEQLRRGLFDYGFSAPLRSFDQAHARRVGIVRANS
jgi:hypothetical protein